MRLLYIYFFMPTLLFSASRQSFVRSENQFPYVIYPYITKRVSSTIFILKGDSIIANKDGFDGNGTHSLHPFRINGDKK